MKKKTKLIIAIVFVLFMIIGAIIGSIFYIKYNIQLTDEFKNNQVCSVGYDTCETTSFVVDEGAWGKSTIIKLYDEGIIRDKDMAYYYYRLVNPASFIAGYYEIPHNLDLYGLIDYLSTESNVIQDTVYVTFYEDDFISDFADKIAAVTNLSASQILEYWNDEDVVRSYMEDYPFLTEDIFGPDVKVLLEGYLAPDTYEFYSYTSCEEITTIFLNQTLAIYEELKDDFDDSEFSIHEIFTLASLCQWESGDLEDMTKIARAFLNRMDEGDYLRSSVTTCYALDFNKSECALYGDIEENNLKDVPYNTYMNLGLPPGPVLCPGRDAIYAALHPARGDYYFFIGDLCYDSGTIFAATYDEHLANIEKYINACSN